jgi:cytochrome c-type protein NapB
MTETPNPSSSGSGRKLAVVAGLVALTLGLSGFFMGLRQTDRAALDAREGRAIAKSPESAVPEMIVPEAPRYVDLPAGRLRPNKDWTVHLATLRPTDPEAQFIPATLAPETLAQLRAVRTSRRQYDGAPPVAPHPTDQLTPAACLECHGKPTTITGRAVPQVSHPRYTNCIQCHVSGAGPASWWQTRNVALSDGNSFSGKAQSGQGTRAYTGAPPTIPHTTWMRDNCMSCHGPGGTAALRTSHPNRQSCTQCHGVNAVLDQRLAAGLPPPLPAADWKTNLKQ